MPAYELPPASPKWDQIVNSSFTNPSLVPSQWDRAQELGILITPLKTSYTFPSSSAIRHSTPDAYNNKQLVAVPNIGAPIYPVWRNP